MVQQIPLGSFFGLKDSQRGGIKYSITIARLLQDEKPEIAGLYLQGHTLDDLARRYSLETEYSVSESTATNAVRIALRGYDGELSDVISAEPFIGLLSVNQYDGIARSHQVQSGRRAKRKNSGIHGLTTGQQREANQSALIAQGKTPWGDDELEIAYALSQDPEYRTKTGTQLNGKRIAHEINRKFHGGKPVRNSRSALKAAKRYVEK